VASGIKMSSGTLALDEVKLTLVPREEGNRLGFASRTYQFPRGSRGPSNGVTKLGPGCDYTIKKVKIVSG